MGKRSDSNKKSKRWLKIIVGVVLGLFIAVVGYSYSIYNDAKQTVAKKVHEEVETIDTSITKKKVEEKQPLNILLLGVDQRKSNSGRSDALMVLSLDPKNNSMQLVSIPRDTRTEIVGRGTIDKINHAYAFGGVDMSIATVKNLLDIDLDYYVRMNMEGLTEMVDAVGGITVNNKLDWYDRGYYKKGYHYARGELTLNGPQTMGYVRMRYQDPDGDFGRTERQRQVIKAVVDKGASFASIGKISNMIDVLGDNVVTNMEFKDMQDLLMNYSDTRQNFTSYMMAGTPQTINGVSYVIVSDDEVAKVHGMIKKEQS